MGQPGDELRRYLAERDIDAEIILPGQDTSTVPAAAAALGVRPDQIVKSLLFQGKDGDLVLAIAPGTSRIDRRKLSSVAGLRQPKLAPPEVVSRATGYPPGGTPPIGHLVPLRVILDPTVLEEAVVYGGGGQVDAMLRIRPDDIRRLTNALVVDVCEGT